MVLCPVEDIRGQAGTGSVLSLDAIGKQDKYLLGDYSFFNYSARRHTNFQVYQTVTNVTSSNPETSNWPFDGTTVTVTLYPKQMGDLLTHMYIKCRLPVMQDVGVPGNPGMFPDSRYCDNVGRAIIKSVKFRVDKYEVETIYDDWMHMYDELYQTSEQKRASIDMTWGVGNRQSGPLDLYIPLPFFFSTKTDSFFPLCAIANQQITIEILFNTVQFFSNSRVNNLSPQYFLGLNSFNLICEQLVVSDSERLAFQVPNYKLLAGISQKQPQVQTNNGDNNISVNLVMNIPVETIHWTMRQLLFEQPDIPGSTNYFLNRYNYSSSNSSSLVVQAVNPIMSDVAVFINNQSELGFFADTLNNDPGRATLYRFAQPLKTNLSAPSQNMYTYAFCLDGLNNNLSGAIDFSQISAQTTFLKITILSYVAANAVSNAFTVQTYYKSLKALTFSNGSMSF